MTLTSICSLPVLIVSSLDSYFSFLVIDHLDHNIPAKVDQSHSDSEDKFLSFLLDVALVFLFKNHADGAFKLDPYALGAHIFPGPVPLLNLVEDAQFI